MIHRIGLYSTNKKKTHLIALKANYFLKEVHVNPGVVMRVDRETYKYFLKGYTGWTSFKQTKL